MIWQITEDFLPIISRIKASTAPLGGPKGEILYAREHEAVWFKGKRFIPSVWAGTPGEEQIRHLKPAIDSKGRKVGEEWFTTVKVEDALTRYKSCWTWKLILGFSMQRFHSLLCFKDDKITCFLFQIP